MSNDRAAIASGTVQLIDMIFPGDANHHGTLFGGVALAHMDKVAFLAATRHGRAPFVTAASDKIDFKAPGRIGEIVEATGRVVRVGNSSLDVEVELVAEALVTGERRTCASGRFAMVAVKSVETVLPLRPLDQTSPISNGSGPKRQRFCSTKASSASTTAHCWCWVSTVRSRIG